MADGSSVQLNTASAVDIDLKHRRLTLVEGEMALNVPGISPLTILTHFGQVVVSQGEVCVRQGQTGCKVQALKGTVQLQPLHGPVFRCAVASKSAFKRRVSVPWSHLTCWPRAGVRVC